MFCTTCGTPMEETDQFCAQCGARPKNVDARRKQAPGVSPAERAPTSSQLASPHEEATHTSTPRTLGWGCGTVVILFAICVGLFTYFSLKGDKDYDTIRMTGEVIVTNPDVCGRLRPELTIKPADVFDGPSTTITYEGAGIAPCRFPIDAEVVLSDAYTLSMDGAGSQAVRRSMIDTWSADGERILEVTLRW